MKFKYEVKTVKEPERFVTLKQGTKSDLLGIAKVVEANGEVIESRIFRKKDGVPVCNFKREVAEVAGAQKDADTKKPQDVPKYVIDTIRYMNNHIAMAQKLGEKLEQWLEKSGVAADGFDYTFDYRDSAAYSIYDVDRFLEEVRKDLRA